MHVSCLTLHVRSCLTLHVELKNSYNAHRRSKWTFRGYEYRECILCNGIYSWHIICITRSVNYTNNRCNEPLHSIPFIELETYRFSTAATIDINPFCSGSFSNSLISNIKHAFQYQLQEITTGQNRRKEKIIRELTRLHSNSQHKFIYK